MTTKQTKILVLGPRATFGHGAGKTIASMYNLDAIYEFCSTNLAVCKELSDGKGDIAIVPLENNAAGIVPDWLSWCAQESKSGTPRAQIVGEIIVDIDQCLMVKPGVTIDMIQKVISHERAIKQCTVLLSKLNVTVEETNSTAEAARIVSESATNVAAIANEAAATEFGLHVLQKHAEDHPGNITRFGILRRNTGGVLDIQETGTKRIIVKFDLPNKVGALHAVTSMLLAHRANMTSLRDLPQGYAFRYSYSFYMDLEVKSKDAEVCIEALRDVTKDLVLFGNFFVSEKKY